MYEHHEEPLASPQVFVRRLAINGLLALLLLTFSLSIGVLGYHYLDELSWIDSLLNASMILGGMGPVNAMTNDAAKIFASLYAIYAGVILLASVGILVAPIFHRFLHYFHLADDERDDQNQ